MTADGLDTQLVTYLSLREALGFQMRAEKIILPEFVAYVQAQLNSSPIRAQMALAWACQASTHRGPSGAARRLRMARGFLRYLQASAPDTEVPGPGLLPTPRRPKPFLFTPTQITALLEVAQASRPRGSLRPHTLSTLIGLLASTGLRVGEAIRLQLEQVKLDLNPPQLHILETKFHKSRIVPLHPSTAERLRHYQAQRARLHCDGLLETFFVSEQGQHLQHRALHDWFARLCQRLAIAPTQGGRAPCLTSFRHTFAVTRMQRWYQQGLDVQALLPHLSVYLGHIHPQESYWYLTAVPELLSAAAHRFETFSPSGRYEPCIAP
jgi:integrase/recombinase XerD